MNTSSFYPRTRRRSWPTPIRWSLSLLLGLGLAWLGIQAYYQYLLPQPGLAVSPPPGEEVPLDRMQGEIQVDSLEMLLLQLATTPQGEGVFSYQRGEDELLIQPLQNGLGLARFRQLFGHGHPQSPERYAFPIQDQYVEVSYDCLLSVMLALEES
ncbi:MAG: hypothetical protein AAFR61_27920 [Bacteroidota bacterium]